VANAGTEGVVTPLTDQTVEDFNQVLSTNVTGVWLAMKHSVPTMKERGDGSIIATSSIAGMIGFPGLSLYIASKHAVFGLVKTACLEFGEAGIRVNEPPTNNRNIRLRHRSSLIRPWGKSLRGDLPLVRDVPLTRPNRGLS
jgi:NAD(P)-dependent dehydrogenase (short-subunit alcohol dehydrogenase family)